jgi:hypothetical protein
MNKQFYKLAQKYHNLNEIAKCNGAVTKEIYKAHILERFFES